MNPILLLSLLLSSAAVGQTASDQVLFPSNDTLSLKISSSGHFSFMIFDSLNGGISETARYDITNDKWTISDTMATIRMLYKQLQYGNKKEDWLRDRIDLMFKMLYLEPDVITGDKKAFFNYHKTYAQLMKLQRNPPQLTP